VFKWRYFTIIFSFLIVTDSHFVYGNAIIEKCLLQTLTSFNKTAPKTIEAITKLTSKIKMLNYIDEFGHEDFAEFLTREVLNRNNDGASVLERVVHDRFDKIGVTVKKYVPLALDPGVTPEPLTKKIGQIVLEENDKITGKKFSREVLEKKVDNCTPKEVVKIKEEAAKNDLTVVIPCNMERFVFTDNNENIIGYMVLLYRGKMDGRSGEYFTNNMDHLFFTPEGELIRRVPVRLNDEYIGYPGAGR